MTTELLEKLNDLQELIEDKKETLEDIEDCIKSIEKEISTYGEDTHCAISIQGCNSFYICRKKMKEFLTKMTEDIDVEIQQLEMEFDKM